MSVVVATMLTAVNCVLRDMASSGAMETVIGQRDSVSQLNIIHIE